MNTFNKSIIVSLCATVLALPTIVSAQDTTNAQTPPAAPAPKGPDSVIVTPATVTESLAAANAAEGRTIQMKRVAEALDTQLRSALGGTGKYKVIVGSNFKQVVDEITRQRNSGLFDSDNANFRGIGSMEPPKYQIVPKIDDFQDIAEQAMVEGLELTARTLRMSLVVSIIDATGAEVENANITVKSPRKNTRRVEGTGRTGDASDELLIAMAREAAIKVADRLVDVSFPAKVAAFNDKEVTINRGDGTNVAPGQVYNVYFVGDAVTDPDTGAVLGKEETMVGQVRVTSVMPKFSKATILTNNGIDRGHVLRLHEELIEEPTE
ncbi:MAG TPA: hypothetical protein VGN72_22440 [Tepidisphaeraceae bacterium]|jgi:hypothetical protein|nr:hypothetical protein [Tepidisphaeraceae bacterium]